MEDNQDKTKLILVVKFNNRKEDWAEFALKLKAIANERRYDKILDGSEDANRWDDENGTEQKRLRKLNKRGYRDLVLSMKEMSLTIVGNAKTNDFSSFMASTTIHPLLVFLPIVLHLVTKLHLAKLDHMGSSRYTHRLYLEV